MDKETRLFAVSAFTLMAMPIGRIVGVEGEKGDGKGCRASAASRNCVSNELELVDQIWSSVGGGRSGRFDYLAAI